MLWLSIAWQLKCRGEVIVCYRLQGEVIIGLALVVYFRLMVHTDAIMDTRAQKMVCHTIAHYRMSFSHDQH